MTSTTRECSFTMSINRLDQKILHGGKGDTPHLDDLEMEDKGDIVLEEEPPKPKPKPKAKPVLKKEPKVEEKKVEPKKVEPKKPEKYDFSNPYVFNEGDVDLEKYMGS